MNLKIQEIVEKVGIKTKDNVFLVMPVKVQLKVIEGKVREAHYELDDPFTQISSYMVNVVRSKANDLTMDEVFQSKDTFETAVIAELKVRFEQYGYEVINVLVDDPVPSEEIKTAFDRVIASKRALEAAQNEAEATRTKMVGEAKAEAESLEIKATAYVAQRKTICTGLKEAVGLLAGVEGVDENRILNYLEGIDLRDTIRDASKGPGTIIVVPTEMGTNGHMANTIGLTKALQPTPAAA
ncbi:MAG: membrane protease subunit, stomatin/prohibitin [Parcubacteria group bacterium Gr01-1014_20]|nr:MAG: membrane protease subunit, stomatin/prohibitin [Parcubacteria group bacterium Gr01-1014_20]